MVSPVCCPGKLVNLRMHSVETRKWYPLTSCLLANALCNTWFLLMITEHLSQLMVTTHVSRQVLSGQLLSKCFCRSQSAWTQNGCLYDVCSFISTLHICLCISFVYIIKDIELSCWKLFFDAQQEICLFHFVVTNMSNVILFYYTAQPFIICSVCNDQHLTIP